MLDKLDNLEEVFEIIQKDLDIPHVKLYTYNDETSPEMGPIRVESFWCEENQRISHNIIIVNGEIEYGQYYDSIHRRLFEFIEMSGIVLSPLTRTVILILHEYGHIDRTNTMYGYNQEKMMHLVDDVTTQILDNQEFMAYAAQASITDGVDISYMLRAEEMYADAFAMKWFPRIWRLVCSTE